MGRPICLILHVQESGNQNKGALREVREVEKRAAHGMTDKGREVGA